MMLNPYVLLGMVVGVLVMCAVSFGAGIKFESDHRDAVALADQKRADKEIEAEGLKQWHAGADYEKGKADATKQTQVITRTITKVVARPAYRNVCLDADGLQLVNAALTGKAADPAGPPAGLPGPKPAIGRHGSKRAAGLRRRGSRVPRLSGAAPRAQRRG